MDYKEKYEMALEGIQEILGSGDDSIKMSRLQLRLQGIFPELKESGEEKIRKVLIELVKCNEKSGYKLLNNVSTSSMVAWLEKQGEQMPAEWNVEEVAKHYLYSNILYDDVYVGNPTDKDCIEMFKAGANWQKQQMMKDAVEGHVMDYPSRYVYCKITKLEEYMKDFKEGDKVKLIVIKEE